MGLSKICSQEICCLQTCCVCFNIVNAEINNYFLTVSAVGHTSNAQIKPKYSIEMLGSSNVCGVMPHVFFVSSNVNIG